MSNTHQDHHELVKALTKNPQDIKTELTLLKCSLIHMGMGVSTEAGELLSSIKSYSMYGKPLDLDNVIEELGDLLFYVKGLQHALGISDEEVLKTNILKLRKRYGEKYSNDAAIARKDKQ